MIEEERLHPDYELEAVVAASGPRQLKALADPLRSTILDLVLDRAATVTELAEAVGRPKSSVAYHVDVLVDAGLLRVVRSRKVRAIEERLYGRVARTVVFGSVPVGGPGDFLAEATAETRGLDPDQMASTLRHVRITEAAAREFFERVASLAEEFSALPREGDQVWGFVAGIYASDQPTLPESRREPGTDIQRDDE